MSRDFHFLLHAADLVERELRLRLAPLGLGPRQARILDALHLLGSVSQVRLAREFSITPASMSTMAARLVAAGLIQRETNPNEARENLLVLTKKGENCIVQIEHVWATVDVMIAEKIGSEDAELLFALTHQLRDAMGGRGPAGK
jgi:DNA-binding MarR family transcriptional regulator